MHFHFFLELRNKPTDHVKEESLLQVVAVKVQLNIRIFWPDFETSDLATIASYTWKHVAENFSTKTSNRINCVHK